MAWKSLIAVMLTVSVAASCGLDHRIDERVVDYVPGEPVAQLQAEAAAAVQERLLESLTGIDAAYTGDARFVVPPIPRQPLLGENVTAVTQAPHPAVTQTGYVPADEEGPDGTPGWYKRAQNGFTFYLKTLPEADLSQRWPSNVQVLWAGWRAGGALRGQSWWISGEVLSPTRMRGDWRFIVGDDAAKYAGTKYYGSYAYEHEPGREVVISFDGAMRLVNDKATRESYARFAYGYTNATETEAGSFYYGVGPAAVFYEAPAWKADRNPAGDAWTNDTQRPGLSFYKLWSGQTSTWLTYEGESHTCSTVPYAVHLRGLNVVSVGRTLQLSADAYNTCKERLPYRTLRWSSRNPGIAAVNDAGLVSGVATGVTDVTVNTGNAWALTSITVRELDLTPAKVGISDGASVQKGGKLQLSATAYNKYNEALAGVPIAWTSSNMQVARVDDTGLVTGRVDGTATIKAAAGGVARERAIRVYDPALVETVSLACPAARTVVSAPVQCTATGYSYTGTALGGAVFTWGSSNPAVLTVSPSGMVSPVAKGTANVTVSANGKQKQLAFTVYGQNDVANVVVASSNGATLRLGDAAFKLALTAKAYNAAGQEIPGVTFSWTSDAPTVAQVTAGPAGTSASVSAGASEGTTNIRATSPNATVGAFAVGNWDNRVSSIRILDASLSDVASVAMTYGAVFQLYVRAFNASNRELGFVTPAWTLPAGVSIDANGLLASASTPGSALTVMASVPKSGGGTATDTLAVTVYDAAKPVSLSSTCPGAYDLFAGATLDCQVTKYNAQNAPIAGAPVTWYVSNPALLTIVSQTDAGSPGSVQFRVPPTLTAGGAVTFKAFAACNGAPQAPAFGNCVVSAQGAVNARGTQDVNYVQIVSPASGTLVGYGDSVLLTAKAYDHQNPPQELPGVAFTYTRQSGTSFATPSAAGVVTATAEGNTYFQATANPGGVSSASFGYSLQGVDPARATVVTLHTIPAILPTLRPYQPFTVWAEATNGLGQAIASPVFNFTTGNTRLEVVSSAATTATLRFVRCDCANTATNSAAVTATYAGTGGGQASRTINVLNTVYNVVVNTPANALVPDSAPYAVNVSVTGFDGQAAPAGATVALQEPAASPAYDVSGLDLTNLVFQNGSSLSVNVYAQDASTACSRTVAWTFRIDPTPIVMTGAAAGSPGLANGYLAKELYYFATSGDFAKALAYATWATTGTTPERTYTNVTNQPLTALSGGYYGVAKISTGDVVTSRIGARVFGYVQAGASTLYLRTQAWERVRVRLGGITVIDDWATTGASSPRAVKLTGLPTGVWVPLEISGLMDAPQTANGQKLGHILWSTNGTAFFDAPSGIGASLAQDP